MTSPARSRLPHALAALYALAIVYVSLQPFGDWIAPPADAPFWMSGAWAARWTRFDLAANVVAYLPLGFFVALVPHRASFAKRLACAIVAGVALSFVLETLQASMPPRDANLIDFASNVGGSLLGAVIAASLARKPRARHALATARDRLFIEGTVGDVGVALLALWIVAQANPAIPLFALNFDPQEIEAAGASIDSAATLIEAASGGFQLVGTGLFVALLMRERAHVGTAVLALIALALVAKGVSGTLLLKPAVWESWMRPGILLGVAAGALLLLFAIFLPRAPQVAVCAVALLSSLLTPLLAPDLLLAEAPLSMFNWRYGHLLNFNGLTHAALVLWPVAASAWLFVLAGRPRWGEPAPLRTPVMPD